MVFTFFYTIAANVFFNKQTQNIWKQYMALKKPKLNDLVKHKFIVLFTKGIT